MAGRGPAPKGRNVRDRDSVELETREATGELHGSPLPEGVLPDGECWHPQTLALWQSLRSDPFMASETDLGWAFLVDTALMHQVMWTKGKWEFASEVRLRLAKYGATPEDRMRLKRKVETPGGPAVKRPEPNGVTDISSRRGRLTGA